MKLLSFQPFSLYRNGGGSRVLRRLYQGRESQVISLVVNTESYPHLTGDISETIIQAIPITKKWMRWRLRNVAKWLRDQPFKLFIVYRIRREAKKKKYDVIHIVNHGEFSTSLCEPSFISNKSLWVSFHDHYTTCSPIKDTKLLWNIADRRLVISEELGREYQKLFGNKTYEIITDGVTQEEVSPPTIINETPILIYFAGLLHWEYHPLFQVLADALDLLSKQGFLFKLLLRGTQPIHFLSNRSFKIEYRTNFISDFEIKQELDSASILYLPIKFTEPNFYLYSLSTKMVNYLGASGSILYHGPSDSAACNLLKQNNSAICCNSLNVIDLMASLTVLLDDQGKISINAKKLANSQFNFSSIQERFWGAVI
jgi:hypothetical protein